MKLPENYYHCFMGNGLDAVLIGYDGSMVPEKVNVDRCYWYKSDRYYPEEKLVKVAGRFPMDQPLPHVPDSGWYEIAPLGRTRYEVSYNSRKLEILSSNQKFEPKEGILYTNLDFGEAQALVTTFLYAHGSVLVEHYEFNKPVIFNAYMAAGVWVEEGWDTNPFYAVEFNAQKPWGSYDLGETYGKYFLHLDPKPIKCERLDDGCYLTAEGKTFTKYFSILDNRQGSLDEKEFLKLINPGYDELLHQQRIFWADYFSVSQIQIPDEQFQYFYEASQYHFKAIQNSVSGGLPVNNLRRTWSSHIFWDSYFIQHAMLESSHINESLEACRFFLRTEEAARHHAEDEFGCEGLKWDWEITHDGRKAYGSLLHMKFQVHNNGSYANEIWWHYIFTQDLDFLKEYFSILEGLATFFMKGIVIQTDRGWEIGPLVGVHESPLKVKNEGTSLAATIDILEHYAQASRILGVENEFSVKCRDVALGLRKTLSRLYNGKYFGAAEDHPKWTMSSKAVLYPMRIIAPSDPRAKTTADEIIEKIEVTDVRNGHKWESAWSSGVNATILAMQGDGDNAWKELQKSRSCMCKFGGMTEVREDDVWNMQYFCTAQGAVMTALHTLLLQSDEESLAIFPALPGDWSSCSFQNLLACGFRISASLVEHDISAEVRNISRIHLERDVRVGKEYNIHVSLDPGEKYVIQTRK